MTNAIKYPDVSVILLAGGKGTRMGSDTPKQYMEVGGKKVIEYSIEELLPLVSELRTIVPDLDSAAFIKETYPSVIISEARESRITSLMEELDKVKTRYVVIHDASRPFVTNEVVDRVMSALKKYPCAYPVVPLASSIVEDNHGFLVRSPDRNAYREVQTPQGFDVSVLKEALEKNGDKHIHIPELVRLLGKEVKHVEGSPWLFKITYAPDIHAAEYYMKHIPKEEQ